MSRSTPRTLAAAFAAAIVLLAGCGSDDDQGTPAADTQTSSAAADTAAGESGADPSTAADPGVSNSEASSGAASESKASEPAAGTSSGGSAGSSAEGGSAGSSAEGGSSGAGSGAATSPDASTEVSTAASAIEMDQTTTQWFSAMCEGLAPYIEQDKVTYDPDGGSVEQQRTAAANYYQQSAGVIGGLADKLDGLPPPTIAGGAEMGQAVVAAYRAAATAADEQAGKIAAATDAESLTSALENADAAVSAAMAPMGPTVESAMGKPGVREGLRNVPACKPLFGN